MNLIILILQLISYSKIILSVPPSQTRAHVGKSITQFNNTSATCFKSSCLFDWQQITINNYFS